MTTLSVRQTFALVALFVATSVTFIQLDNRAALDPVKTALHDLVQPVARAFGGLAPGDGGAGDGKLQGQIAQLERERDALIAENARLKADNREVEQLRSQLDVQQKNPDLKLLSARVVSVDPTNQDKFIVIDKGSADGLRVGMAVVDPYFFVGQITDVDEHAARVTLVIDQEYQVAARLENAGADGILYGQWQRGGRIELRHVDRDTQIPEGERVLTSDNADVRTQGVPGALVIGQVIGEPTRSNQDDTLTIQVLPAVDFENLQVVSVILSDAADQS